MKFKTNADSIYKINKLYNIQITFIHLFYQYLKIAMTLAANIIEITTS